MKFVTLSNVLIAGLIAVIVVMGLQRCSDKPENVEVKKPSIVPVVQKVDEKGTSYSEIKGTLYTEAQMKSLTDSFRKVLGKGKVTQITTTVTQIDTFLQHDTLIVNTETGEIYAADSSAYHKVSYTGNYLLHTGGFQLTFRPDTVMYITTIKNKWLGRDEMTTNVYNSNPFFIPSMGTSYTFKPRRVIGTLGPTIGVGYSSGTNKLQAFIGIGFTANLISIKTK